MYRYMAIANYEDRFVIPTTHREYAENAYDLRGGCGFSFGNGCSDGQSEASLFGGKKRKTIPIKVACPEEQGDEAMKTLKLLAVLLSYPSADLVAALPEIARRLGEERALRRGTQDALAGLLAELKREDLLDLQERYVAQFDTGRSTSLHLFEHVHGDSRDRGQAMVDLNALYRALGLRRWR